MEDHHGPKSTGMWVIQKVKQVGAKMGLGIAIQTPSSGLHPPEFVIFYFISSSLFFFYFYFIIIILIKKLTN